MANNQNPNQELLEKIDGRIDLLIIEQNKNLDKPFSYEGEHSRFLEFCRELKTLTDARAIIEARGNDEGS